MLIPEGLDFAAVLEEVGRLGASRVPGFLRPDHQRELLASLEGASFQRAPEHVGRVYQDFDLLEIRPGVAPADPCLSPVLALCDEYAAFVTALAKTMNAPSLASFAPTDIDVQRYTRGSRGITPHRDRRRFVKLITVFSLGSPAEFRLCRDREGTPLRRYRLASGDLLLLRAPGFAGQPSAGPLHSVSGPLGDVRYSIGLRMESQPGTSP